MTSPTDLKPCTSCAGTGLRYSVGSADVDGRSACLRCGGTGKIAADARPPVQGEREALTKVIEPILFRRALEGKLDGYTLPTAQEIADALPRSTSTPQTEAQDTRQPSGYEHLTPPDELASSGALSCTHEFDDYGQCLYCNKWAQEIRNAERANKPRVSDCYFDNSGHSISLHSASEGDVEGAPLSEVERYAALGRAAERCGLAWYNEDGEMRFQPPADLIAEQAAEQAVAALSRPMTEEVRAEVELQVRLAMQEEMLSPDNERVRRRHDRAAKAADAILSAIASGREEGK